MQGNSLLETYEGIELIDRHFLVRQDDKNEQRERMTARLNNLSQEYIELHQTGKLTPTEKTRLDREIKALRASIAALDQPPPPDERNLRMWGKTEPQAKAERLLQLHREFFAAYHKREKERLHREIETLTWDLIETTLKQQKKTQALEEIRRFQRTNTRPFFLWRLYFADVFQRNAGFDVLIANPPYLESRSPNFDDKLKDALQASLKSRLGPDAASIRRGADLLVYFFELTLRITAPAGTIVFLTQNSWLDTEYGRAFQTFLLDHCHVRAIIDSDFKYFDSRTGPNINTVITVFAATTPAATDQLAFVRFHEDLLPYAGIVTTEDPSLPPTVGDIHVHTTSNPILRDQKWGTLLSMSPGFAILLDALSRLGKRLDQLEGVSITIGQGLNGTKHHEIPTSQLDGNLELAAAIVPIHSAGDGAPLVLTSTTRSLLDAALAKPKPLKAASFSSDVPYTFSSRRRHPPRLILPRGIGRHYCAWNAVNAYSASGVDIYADDAPELEDLLLSLWAFLNSSAAWLLREITGRKNLGGGMLKAEAADLKQLPILVRLPADDVRALLKIAQSRKAGLPLDELDSAFHRNLDALVFHALEISDTNANIVISDLKRTVSARQSKAKR